MTDADRMKLILSRVIHPEESGFVVDTITGNISAGVFPAGIGVWAHTPPGSQPAPIADAGATYSAATQTTINSILAALRGCGIINT